MTVGGPSGAADIRRARRLISATARKIALRPLTVADRWIRADPLLPPLDLRWEYYRSANPDAFRRASSGALLELTSRGLEPVHRVLDIGCGIGNLAVALAGWLRAEYHGFDVNDRAIEWCRRALSVRWPNFQFHHVDLESAAYNRAGRGDPALFVFPLPTASIDVAFAGSVFTHLLEPAARQYLRECGRVLAPGATCIASFFLLNGQSRSGVDRHESFMGFEHAADGGRSRVHNPHMPEAAVALDEAWVMGQLGEVGLRVVDVRRGRWWCGASDDQDVITAVREENGSSSLAQKM